MLCLTHTSGVDFDDEDFGFQEENKSNIKVGLNRPYTNANTVNYMV